MTDTINVPREPTQEMLKAAKGSGVIDPRVSGYCYQLMIEAAPAVDTEGLEVVAWQDAENPAYVTSEKRQMHGWATDGYPIVPLCSLPKAQAVIDQLKAENEVLTLRVMAGERQLIEFEWFKLNNELLAAEIAALKSAPVAVCPKCFDLTGCPSCAPAVEVEGLEVIGFHCMDSAGIETLEWRGWSYADEPLCSLPKAQAIIDQQAARIAELEREICYLMGQINGSKGDE